MSKTKEVHKELHIWDREVLKGPVNKLKKLKREFEKRRRGPLSDDNLAAQKRTFIAN